MAVEVFVTDAARARHGDLLDAAAAAEVPVRACAEDAVAVLAETVTPQGVVAVCLRRTSDLSAVLAQGPRLLAVLSAVRDPGNAGAVVRCADAAGADAVVLTAGSVDPYNGKAVRASAGSLFHLPLVIGAELPGVLERLRAGGLTVLAADASGALDLDEAADTGLLAGPTAWVFGNEAWGMSAAERALADAVVRVPLRGRAESLNLATAAAVCLYASAREQRRPPR